jgi:hypothetical protein
VRLLRFAIISLIVLFGVVTAISLLIPSNIQLTKIISIRAQRDSVFTLIRDKDQWFRWHPSFLNGERLEMLSKISVNVISVKDSVLSAIWEQEGKKPLNMEWQMHEEALGSATLQWRINFHLSWYPWEKMSSLFYEKNYGLMMEQGLLNIKKELENKN